MVSQHGLESELTGGLLRRGTVVALGGGVYGGDLHAISTIAGWNHLCPSIRGLPGGPAATGSEQATSEMTKSHTSPPTT